MGRVTFAVLALVSLPMTVWAQNYPMGDIFAGFSINREPADSATLPGWQASAAVNVRRSIGLVLDLGGQYNGPDAIHEFLLGPRFNARSERVTGFAHALFGFTHGSVDAGTLVNGFTMGFGGGADVKAGNRLMIRVVQADWLPMRFRDRWSTEQFRLGFGFTTPFGQP